MEHWPGAPAPLGATWDGVGTNFAVFSEAGRRGMGVELSLYDGATEQARVRLDEVTANVWHAYLTDVGPGQHYGFRVAGPFWPAGGLFCNGNKLLLDPYARAIDGGLEHVPEVLPSAPGNPAVPDDHDSASHVPRSVVIDPAFAWGDDARPRTPLADTILYECHVRGITMRHPDVPAGLRGTYAGLVSEAVLDHLIGLGVTAVELLPVHHFVSERHLARRGLVNYWGYASVGFFAPHAGYSSSGSRGEQVSEFKAMVRALHAAGIEVILDVVYNHTGEAGPDGPLLCFRGLDNPVYYRLDAHDRGRYQDFTGTGNSVNVRSPEVLRLIMASLRYWVTDMHVDGFRFDLASTLARDIVDPDQTSAFFDLLYQDPVLSDVKLIAEPWDVGDRGYQVGNFPLGWAEWNDRYRDGVRDFWRGWSWGVGELATRLAGSSDLYADDGRLPTASVNFVTAHDGFSLADLVAYDTKHNEANGEGNADGTDNNRSWNCGVEGPTSVPEVLALRRRQQRNFLATTLLSLGVPMLLGGDELGRTQSGNNNAYCQDNEISWYDWSALDADLLAFARAAIGLRRSHRVFCRRRFLTGGSPNSAGVLPDVAWLRADGQPMTDADWGDPGRRTLQVFLNGDEIGERGARGERLVSGSFLLLFNAGGGASTFVLPDEPSGRSYQVVLDTQLARGVPDGAPAHPAGAAVELQDRSLVVLQRQES